MLTITDSCPRCGGEETERNGEFLFQRANFTITVKEHWMECLACHWTWTTEGQRKFNRKSFLSA